MGEKSNQACLSREKTKHGKRERSKRAKQSKGWRIKKREKRRAIL